MKVAILDDWFDTLKHLPCFTKLAGHDVTIFTDHVPQIDQLIERLAPFEVVVLFRERTKIPAELLNNLPNLKLISHRSAYPHVDIQACTNNGILFCSNTASIAPSYAAAEHTWGLILSAMRQIPQQMANLARGQWQLGVGKSLRGRTLGLYGYGRIGQAVEQYAQSFGMNVIWWGSETGKDKAIADGKNVPATRAEFFQQADVISLHVRLKASTKGLLNAQDLANMKTGALLVNTSRSGLIEAGALLTGLNKGSPAMAALDVFDEEPITWANDPLATHPNVIATPHIGFVTEDEFEIQFSDMFDQIVALANNAPINMINPEVWQAVSEQ